MGHIYENAMKTIRGKPRCLFIAADLHPNIVSILFSQNLPESNPARMEESRRRNALTLQALKDAAETKDNLARGYGGQK